MHQFSRIFAGLLGLVLCSCGGSPSDHKLPDIDKFSASKEDIAAYGYSFFDITEHFKENSATCLPPLDERESIEIEGNTYRDLANYLARSSGMLYRKDERGKMVKEKKRTPVEFIDTFGWNDKLAQTLPDLEMCFPDIEAYERYGPLPEKVIKRKIKARKRANAIRELIGENFDKIAAPTEDGLYLVTKGFELIPVPSLGEKIKFPMEVETARMPDRFTDRYSGDDEMTQVYCIRQVEPVTVSIRADKLYGIYLRNGASHPMLTFSDETIRPVCKDAGYTNSGYDDFVQSAIGFGWRARRDDDTLLWMINRARPGDIYALETDKRDSWDEAKVALFRVE